MCAFRKYGRGGLCSRYLSRLCYGHPHDTTSLALLRQNARPRARTVHTCTLRIAGSGWHISGLVGVATSTAVWARWSALGTERHYYNVFCLLSVSLSLATLYSWSVESVSIIRGDGSYTHGMLWGVFPLSSKRVTPHRILRLRQPNVVACHHGSIRLCADRCQEQACNIAQCTVDMRALHKRRTEPGGRSSLAASQSCRLAVGSTEDSHASSLCTQHTWPDRIIIACHAWAGIHPVHPPRLPACCVCRTGRTMFH